MRKYTCPRMCMRIESYPPSLPMSKEHKLLCILKGKKKHDALCRFCETYSSGSNNCRCTLPLTPCVSHAVQQAMPRSARSVDTGEFS